MLCVGRLKLVLFSWWTKNQVSVKGEKYELDSSIIKRFILGRVLFLLFVIVGIITSQIVGIIWLSFGSFIAAIVFGLVVHYVILPKDVNKYLHKKDKQ